MISRRRTETTIETHELWVIRKSPGRRPVLCRECAGGEMLTPEEAARVSGVNTRAVYRWVEDGRVHFTETADGRLFVCLAPV